MVICKGQHLRRLLLQRSLHTSVAQQTVQWTAPARVPVVIVGAGPTGLVLSSLLSVYGGWPRMRECMLCAGAALAWWT
jgi:hypothetical protein